MNNVRVFCISTFKIFCDNEQSSSEYAPSVLGMGSRLEYPGRPSFFTGTPPRHSYHHASVIGVDFDSLTQALRSRGRNLGTRLRKRARVGLRFTEMTATPTVLPRKTVNQEKPARLAPYETEESGNRKPSFSDLKSGKASGFTTETVANRETKTIRRVPPVGALEMLKSRSNPKSGQNLPTYRNQTSQARNQRSPLDLSQLTGCNDSRLISTERSGTPSSSLLDKERATLLPIYRPIRKGSGAIQKLAENQETEPEMFSAVKEMAQQEKNLRSEISKTPSTKSKKTDPQNRERAVYNQKDLELVNVFGSRPATVSYQSQRRLCMNCRINTAYWSASWCEPCIWRLVKE